MQYLSVFADRFSKGVVLDPVGVDSSTPVIAKCLVDSLICQHGAPTHLHTDNDPRVTNSLFEEMCKLFGIKHTLTSPDHAQSDGQTERMNENVVRLLRLFIADGVCTESTWDTVVQRLQFLIGASVNSTTGKTPHRMEHGRELRDGFLSPPSGDGDVCTQPSVVQQRKQWRQMVDRVTSHVQSEQKRWCHRHNRKVTAVSQRIKDRLRVGQRQQ